MGEAIGEWKGDNINNYEHVQCILIDIRYLMNNYKIKCDDNIMKLANVIKEAFKEK